MKHIFNKVFYVLLVAVLILTPQSVKAASYDFDQYSDTDMGVIIYEANSGDIIISRNASEKYYPGSITKILTAITALDYLSLQEEITVRQEVLDMTQPYSSIAHLQDNEILTFEQLLYAMLLPSGNDAALVIAVAAGEKIASEDNSTVQSYYYSFIKEMNLKAKKLGMTDSHFANSDGYDDDDNYSTPMDLIILGQAALKIDVLNNITSSKYQFVESNKAKHHWYSTNLFLYQSFDALVGYSSARSGSNPFFDSRITGLKTGYTDIGGRCLLFSGQSEDMELIGIVLDVPPSDSNEIWRRCSSLVDFTFENFTRIPLIDDSNRIYEYQVSNHGFLASSTLELTAIEDESACIENEQITEISTVITVDPEIAQLKDNGKLQLLIDIQEGDKVAYMTFSNGDTLIKSVAFIATEDYSKAGFIDYALYVVISLFVLLFVIRIIADIKKNREKRIRRNGKVV